MKKLNLTYLLVVISTLGFSQQEIKRGRLTIKRYWAQIDTLTRFEEVLDSTNYKVTKTLFNATKEEKLANLHSNIIGSVSGSEPIKINNNTYLKRRSIIFINRPVPQKKVKKIREKAKRNNKLYYFELRYQLVEIDSAKQGFYSNREYIDGYNLDTKESFNISKSDSSFNPEIKSLDKTTSNLLIFHNDTIINNTEDQKLKNKILSFINDDSQIKWIMSSPKTIYKNNYKIEFDLKKIQENKLVIIKNDRERFVCSYKIKNRYIYIEDSPLPEIRKGKFNTRKTSLKFKVHSTTHEFTIKT